jgi:hypothetical protein
MSGKIPYSLEDWENERAAETTSLGTILGWLLFYWAAFLFCGACWYGVYRMVVSLF